MAGGDFFEPENYPGNGNSGMQTLGAKNDFVRNNRKRSTLDTKRPSKGPAPTPPQVGSGQYGGIHNSSYKNDSDEEEMGANQARNDMKMNQMYGSGPRNGDSRRGHDNSLV